MQQGKNMGSIGLLLSIIAIIAGVAMSNLILIAIGGFGFVKLVNTMCRIADKRYEIDINYAEARAYSIKRQADSKAELLSKAYKDGKVKDEDISFLVRSLAADVKSNTTQVNQRPVVSAPVQAIEANPVVEVSEVVEDNTTQSESEDNNVIPYEINSGRFVFKYKGKDMAFGPSDVAKNEYLHEEFNDSAGYYKNADAVFYIYPSEKQIAVVEI